MTTETNEERLGKLRFRESVAANLITGQANISLELIAWAVQQAERVQELESMNSRAADTFQQCEDTYVAENARLLRAHELKDMEHDGLVQQLKEFRKENTRLRKALEFYGTRENYEPRRMYGPFGYDVYRILGDEGNKARTALNTQEGTE